MDGQENSIKKIIKAYLKKILASATILCIIILVIAAIFYGTVTEIVKEVGKEFNNVIDNVIIQGNNLEIDQEYLSEAKKRLQSMGIEEETLGLGGHEEYLERFLEAEIVTNFPYLGGDKLQGTVYFERAQIDGSTIQLEYKPYDEFYSMKNSSNGELYKYFTIDTEDWTAHVIKSKSENSFEIEKINYKDMVSKYSMPFEFPIALAMTTQNPQFALAVVNLVKDSKIVITIAESKKTETTDTTYTYLSTITTIDKETDEVISQNSSNGEETIQSVEEIYSTSVFLSRANTWILNEIVSLNYEDTGDVEGDPQVTKLDDENYTYDAGNNITVNDITDRKKTVVVTIRHQRWNRGKSKVIEKTSNFTDLILRDSNAISGTGFLEVAKECHDYLADNNYWYPTQANLAAGGYVQDGSPVTHKFPEIGEPPNQRHVDCSAYVCWVLRNAGYTDIPCLSTYYFPGYAREKGWEEIKNIDDLQPGDIILFNGHTNILVYIEDGNYYCYDCGNTPRIRAKEPINYDVKGRGMICAYRLNDEIAKALEPKTIKDLKESVQNYIDTLETGKYQVSVESLDKNSSNSFIIGYEKVKSEGWIKLFIMATAYDQIKKGNINEEDISADIERMITTDSNEAANLILTKLGEEDLGKGIEKVKQYLRKNSYANTNIEEQLSEVVASAGSDKNYTTTSDVNNLLEKIFKGKCINNEYSDKMLQLLKGQLLVEYIPSNINNGEVANKTGEQSDILQDAAIVSLENANYLLSISVSDVTDKEEAANQIREIARIVNVYFTENGTIKNNSNNFTEDEEIDTILNGRRVCYKVQTQGYECPLDNLEEGSEMLFEILASSEKTQSHENLMRYLLYLLTNDDSYGVKELDFEEFLNGSFSNIPGVTSGRYAMVLKFIEFYEGCTPEADGKYKVIHIGDGVRTVGKGVTLENCILYFEKYGINIDDYPVGSWMDKEIVEKVKMDVIIDKANEVERLVADFNLEPWQIDALISRIYNCGNLGGFKIAYSQYGDTEALYNNYMSTPITDKDGNVYPGLITRRKREWKLFHEGIYDLETEVIDARDVDYSGSTNESTTDAQKRIVEIASSQDTLGTVGGQCQKWISHVYREAGLGEDTRCCASVAAEAWIVSKDKDNIPLGACVYGHSSRGTIDSVCGKNAGHVGIYIGDGQVASNVGGIKIESLESWINTYQWKGWGWNGGFDASKR